MKNDPTKSVTQIAEGLPPASPIHVDHVMAEERDVRLNEPTAMQVFFAWEKLRILYNAVLILLTLLKIQLTHDDFGLETLILGALIANACFCAGPVAEGYVCWIGLRRSIMRPVIFVIGMSIAIGLAISARPHDLGPPMH